MAQSTTQTCESDACTGAVSTDGSLCLAHMAKRDRERLLKDLSKGKVGVAVAGVPMTPALLSDLVAAHNACAKRSRAPCTIDLRRALLPPEPDLGAAVEGSLLLDDALVDDALDLSGLHVRGDLSIRELGARADASLRVSLRGARVGGNLTIGSLISAPVAARSVDRDTQGDGEPGTLDLVQLQVSGRLVMESVHGMGVLATGMRVGGSAEITEYRGSWLVLNDAEFVGGLRLADSSAEYLDLAGALFDRLATFEGVDVRQLMRLDRAHFRGRACLGSEHSALSLGGDLSAPETTFDGVFQAHMEAAVLYFGHAMFRAGGAIMIDAADCFFDHSRFELAFYVAAMAPEVLLPRVLSFKGADVRNVGLAMVDLTACEFRGAFNLDKLWWTGVTLPEPPEGLHVGRAAPPVWAWSRRYTVAEEHAYRLTTAKSSGWSFESAEPIDDLTPHGIVEVYRSLRRGLESRKDEGGAADFYYGEMEMRRRASTRRRRRLLFFAYWAVSGYGLKASRALLTLAAFVVVASLLTLRWGYSDDVTVTLSQALIATVGVLFRIEQGDSDPAVDLTPVGQVLQAVVATAGPALAALAVLSVRGSIRR